MSDVESPVLASLRPPGRRCVCATRLVVAVVVPDPALLGQRCLDARGHAVVARLESRVLLQLPVDADSGTADHGPVGQLLPRGRQQGGRAPLAVGEHERRRHQVELLVVEAVLVAERSERRPTSGE